ncbi:hypothetical protein A9974_03235 [Achromobacter sp. UMC71]|nr:hypothetical protein [Achromobacter sp. UMC71]
MAAAAIESTTVADTVSQTSPERCMRIQVHQQDDRLTLQSTFDTITQTVSPERSAAILSKEFRRVYDMLEENRRLDARFDARMAILSHELLGPLLPGLRKAPCVIFQIEPTSMHFALDLLPLDGVPLFVQKPVAFGFADAGGAPAVQGQSAAVQVAAPATGLGPQSKGLILRDLETDPDDGTGEVQKLYPGSKFQLIGSATPDMFARSRYDFLLISGEGVVSPTWGKPEKDENDAIGLGEDDMYPQDLHGAAFKLVYLDASQLALSKAFIDAARRSGARHYLAPIISNEAGHSSTLTLRYFFGGLKQGMAPIDALYRTRRQIYKEFEGRVNRTEQIYYAYPFRLYLL